MNIPANQPCQRTAKLSRLSKSKVDLQVFVKSASQRLLVNKEDGGV